jgi:hypothetical protein
VGFDPSLAAKGLGGPPPPVPERERVPDARGQLKTAIAERDLYTVQMRRLDQAVADAMKEEATAKVSLQDVAAHDRANWATWADGDHSDPAPVSSLARRTELEAIHRSAERKLVNAIATRDEHRPTYQEAMQKARASIEAAQLACVLEEADDLRRELFDLGNRIARTKAALGGVHDFLAKMDRAIAAAVTQPVITQEDRKRVEPELAAIRLGMSRWCAVLLVNPDAPTER